MGMFSKSCGSGTGTTAPAPNPSRFSIIDAIQYPCAYVLKVRYPDATNFEGIKVMVFLGKCPKRIENLDPHFYPGNDSPVARFKPDADGEAMAHALAARIGKV